MNSRARQIATFVILSCVLSVVTLSAQTTIHVPADQATIQAAIDAANNGDTVLVDPGTYFENMNFNGKAITVTSSGGAAVTIIDGGKNGSVVSFHNSETLKSVLNGFTLQNGEVPSSPTTMVEGFRSSMRRQPSLIMSFSKITPAEKAAGFL